MVLVVLALGAAVCSLAYVLVATLRVRWFRRCLTAFQPAERPAPLTLLKPIYGSDPELLENLRSCCRQQFPEFQIVFGFRCEDDPAIADVHRVMDEFPDLDLELVIDPTVSGPNLKVSSLANMLGHAKHDIIVVADSDVRVPEDYLARVAKPFENTNVGAVTCLYRGRALGGVYSHLGALFVNDWFLPSALVSSALRPLRYCFGATMAVRRTLLDSIGSFQALADYLADDYELGARVAALGFRIELAPCVVENVMQENKFHDLFRHELRWGRTMRTVEPTGFAAAAITDLVPISLLAGLAVWVQFEALTAAVGVICVAWLARALLHYASATLLSSSTVLSPWLILPRDLMTAVVRLWSFIPGPVVWRGHRFNVDHDGKLTTHASGD